MGSAAFCWSVDIFAGVLLPDLVSVRLMQAVGAEIQDAQKTLAGSTFVFSKYELHKTYTEFLLCEITVADHDFWSTGTISS